MKLGEKFCLYTLGGGGYTILELLWRGRTHWSMAFTGGFCFLSIFKMNLSKRKESIWKRCLWAASIITSIEFFVGYLVNKICGLRVWDYSKLKWNLCGQISLLYSFLWFLLSFPLCRLSEKIIPYYMESK